MSTFNSIKAQKLAEDLLGLDMQTQLPEHAAYRGKLVEGISGFYSKNKRPIMIVGGVLLAAGVAMWGYSNYKKNKAAAANSP